MHPAIYSVSTTENVERQPTTDNIVTAQQGSLDQTARSFSLSVRTPIQRAIRENDVFETLTMTTKNSFDVNVIPKTLY